LMYRSLWRRAIFVALSIAIPIVANWVRAYMIVMIGHLSDMRYAVGVDHLIYGWLFFGLIMLILFWIGSFWREDHLQRPRPADSIPLLPRAQPAMTLIIAASVTSAVTVAVWPELASSVQRADAYPTAMLQVPAPASGWQPVDGPVTTWTPHFLNPAAQITQAYRNGANRVGLYIGRYRNQRQGAELITSMNTLVGTDAIWSDMGATRRSLHLNDKKLSVVEMRLRGRSAQLLTWHWYWVDRQYTTSPYWAKLLQAKSALSGRGDDAAVVIVYTELEGDPQVAGSTLHSFAEAMLPALTRSLDDAR
jgi:EpsI family protein